MSAPARQWKCAVVIAMFAVALITGGLIRAFGVWSVAMAERFDCGPATRLLVVGAHVLAKQLLFPVCSRARTKISARALIMLGGATLSLGLVLSAFAQSISAVFITFSAVGGLGSGLCTFGFHAAMVDHFQASRLVAFAVAGSGLGVGTVVLPPVMAFLFGHCSYGEAVIVLACVALHLVVAGAVCFPAPGGEQETHESFALLEARRRQDEYQPLDEQTSSGSFESSSWEMTVDKGRMEALCRPVVVLNGVGLLLAAMGYFSSLQLLVGVAVEAGMSPGRASLLLSTAGIVDSAAYPFLRRIAGRLQGAHSSHLVQSWNISLAGAAMASIAVAFSLWLWDFVLSLSLMAACLSVCRAFAGAAFAQMFDTKEVSIVAAAASSLVGLGALTGAAAAGLVAEMSGAFVNSYLLMAALSFASATLLWMNFNVMAHTGADPPAARGRQDGPEDSLCLDFLL